MMKEGGSPNLFYFFGLITQVGLVMVASILLGLAGGLALDKFLNLSPWGLTVGLFLGIGGGFFAVYKMIMTKLNE